jgi:Zn-dependent peptidase ImmA (M78 family)/DNA-binding XRE family transcriptional regulator
MNKTALAKRVGVDLRSISAFESGEFEPSPETMARIVDVLDFPVGFFSGDDLHEPSSTSVSFRSLARKTASNRDAALASGALAIRLNDWLEERFTLPASNLPDLREEDPETAAMTLRNQWGLGERPVRNIVHLLESKGIRVFSMAEDTTEIDAFSYWRETTPFVFLNTMKSAERSRFDAAHELGHLVLHRHANPQGKEVEHEANRFASAFLMPRGSVFAHAPIFPSLATLIKLKRHWIVSVAAVAYRLHSLGLLSDWHYRSLCIEMAQRGYRTNEPVSERPEMSLVLKKIFQALKDDGMNRFDLARELQYNVQEIDKVVFGLVLTCLPGGNNAVDRGTPHPLLRRIK